MKAVTKGEQRTGYLLVLILVLLVAGIVMAGRLHYRNYERHFRTAAEHQLTAIAELKVGDLAQYRQERLEDASIFFNNTVFSGLVRRFRERPEAVAAQKCLVAQLEESLSKVKPLSGLLPICSACKKIRDDRGHWSQVESYIQEHTDAQ
jgi:hypothetical protein